MAYYITFRSKSDAYPSGWYTGDHCRWSTDHKRKKLFDRKEDAEPLVVRLRELCPSNAESIIIESAAQMKSDLDQDRAAQRITVQP